MIRHYPRTRSFLLAMALAEIILTFRAIVELVT